MIYHLFTYLEQFDFPGAGMFQYLSSRAAFTVITSLVISMIVGKRIIAMLHRKQIVELGREVEEKGLTLVPLRLYLKSGRAKVELALARGRRQYDRRQAIARREAEREMRRSPVCVLGQSVSGRDGR